MVWCFFCGFTLSKKMLVCRVDVVSFVEMSHGLMFY